MIIQSLLKYSGLLALLEQRQLNDAAYLISNGMIE